ncbi:MAG TPA: HlyD family secretion protein [Vicinamibacterales bacterium]|nr:HlyD family secretion protein [Vicinamibacterales bacterium]
MAADEVTKAEPRRIRVRLIAGIVVIILAGVGLWLWHTHGRESTDDAQIDGHITPIAARVGGTVTVVDVHDNEPVHKGDRLAQIDPRDYQLAVEQAQAALADAEANAQALNVGVPITSTTTQGDVSISRAAVEAARSAVIAAEHAVTASRARYTAAQATARARAADATKADKDLDRLSDLIKKDEISHQHYDAAVAAATAARAGRDAAVADAEASKAGVTVAESQLTQVKASMVKAQADVESAKSGTQQVAVDQARVKAADARVEQAKAALAQAQLNLAYTTVVAPTDGIISKKSIEPGQVIQAGQPLLAIVPLEDVWVTANFKETQLDQMRPGQRATVSVDALDGRTFEGHVDSIAAATGARFSLLPPENATGNYVKVVQRIPVKIVLEKGQDPGRLLRPGMSVEPTVYTK